MQRRFFAVLHGAAARACGQLRQLHFSSLHAELEKLLPVLTAYAGSLRELHLGGFISNYATSYTTTRRRCASRYTTARMRLFAYSWMLARTLTRAGCRQG